jgi:hypothetical protein
MGIGPTAFDPSVAHEADGATVDTVTIFGAEDGHTYTVSTTLGTILTADADPNYVGLQVTASGTSFTLMIRRPSGEGTALIGIADVTGAKTGCSTIEYVLPNNRRFDFNSGGSPTQSPSSPGTSGGYIGVQPGTLYTANLGYGWTSAPTGGFDRGDLAGTFPQEELRRDGHFGSGARTFQVDLSNGTYFVNVTLGDASFARDQMRVRNADVASPGGVLVSSANTAAGQFFHDGFEVTVTDGSLNLEFSDLGGDPTWTANGLEIRPAPLGGVVFTSMLGSLPANSTMTDTIMGTGPAGALLSLTTSLGTIVTDDSAQYAGTQVLVPMSGTFSFMLQRPSTAGTPTFTAEAVDGSAEGSSSSVVTYTFAGLFFDMNNSPTQTTADADGRYAGTQILVTGGMLSFAEHVCRRNGDGLGQSRIERRARQRDHDVHAAGGAAV